VKAALAVFTFLFMNKSAALLCMATFGHLSFIAFVVSSLAWLPAQPARADWSSTSSSQLVLKVDTSSGTANAAGQTYAISGNGLSGTPVLNSGAAPAAGLALTPINAGAAFSLTMSVKSADTLTTVSPSGSLPAYTNVEIQQPGSAGTLAGSVTSPTTGSATAGGPGTSATLTQSNTFSVF
jgi:hypothetical protein